MANGTIYRGYEIKPVTGGFMWQDERNFDHYGEGVTKTPYATEDDAMSAIDAYKRAMSKAAASKAEPA